MKEISSDTLEAMQSAVSLQSEQSFRSDFDLNRDLPENLKALESISANYYWSWATGGAELFRELGPTRWEKYEQNPRVMLKNINQFRLWQKSLDHEYVEKVNRFAEKLRNYLNVEPQSSGRVTKENPAAYFCAEYGVHNS